jgi:hypothetical protein
VLLHLLAVGGEIIGSTVGECAEASAAVASSVASGGWRRRTSAFFFCLIFPHFSLHFFFLKNKNN